MSSYIDDATLILATHVYVKAYMSQYDSSHDYSHILRVLTLSRQILAAVQSTSPSPAPHPTVVTLLALLHDVGDKKYLPAFPSPSSPSSSPSTPLGFGPVEEFLISAGADPAQAALVQKLVNNVSYSHERANPENVAALCREYPELAIVQDADRLDAIGAIGVGRTFTFGAVKKQTEGMQGVMRHLDEKLMKLEEGMKTIEGRRLAGERGERIRIFRDWWEDEMRGVYEEQV